MSDKVNGSAPPHFKATLDVTAQSETLVTAFCIDHLRNRGFHVASPHLPPERPSDFMRRIGIKNWNSLHRDIALWQEGGGGLTVRYYPGGRIREILSNAEFDKFLVRFKKS